MNVAEATHTPRFHHQWLPDRLFVEPAINQDTAELLEAKGYNLKHSSTMGSTQSIQVEDYIYGSSDPRRPNAKAAGFECYNFSLLRSSYQIPCYFLNISYV